MAWLKPDNSTRRFGLTATNWVSHDLAHHLSRFCSSRHAVHPLHHGRWMFTCPDRGMAAWSRTSELNRFRVLLRLRVLVAWIFMAWRSDRRQEVRDDFRVGDRDFLHRFHGIRG